MGNADLRWLLKDAWHSVARGFSRNIARKTGDAPASVTIRRRAVFEEMEARLLYSADLAPGVFDGAVIAQVQSHDIAAPSAVPAGQDHADTQVRADAAVQTTDTNQQSHQIVFIDTSVAQWQDLLADVQKTHPDAEVITLDATRDGIAQITDALAGRSDVSAIHLITHGAAGELQIGNVLLNADTLSQYANSIHSWQNALAPGADFLLYGCDVAADDAGQQFVDALGTLTGTDIAASEDLTGNAALGGDWTLEYTHGNIETNVIVDTATQASWDSTLAIVPDSTTSAATTTASVSSLTFSHTQGTGLNGILVVEYSTRGATSPTSITYGGQNLTQLSSISDAGATVTTEIWYLLAPASGTANVVVTLPSPHEFTVGATSFFNVDQTTPFGTVQTGTGTGTTPSINVASATGDLVIDSISSRQQTGTPTVAGGQTSLWTNESGTGSSDPLGASSTKAGAASVTMSWTLTDSQVWAALGVSMHAAANTAPVVNTTAAALAYTENAAATAIDNALTVTDDGVNLTGATVKITSNYQSGQDVLAFTNQLGITGSWNSATGTLTLSGTTTVANYQTALRAVTYQNTSDNPSTAARTITFTANDGSLTGSGTRNINVTAVNDAPVITTSGTTLSYTENAAATAVDNALTVSDVDSTNLTGATVQITANYSSSQDVLAFTNQLGITGSWNSATGTLTLTGTTTVANYQTALRAVTYQNTSDNPSTATRTVTFTANDGAATGSATRNLSVTAVNDAPIVTTTGTTLSYTENAAATSVDNALTVSDVDSTNLAGATVQITGNYQNGQDVLAFTNQLGISGSWNATTGTLTLTGTTTVANYQTALRAVTYQNTSDNPSTLTRTVSFVASDGSASSNTATRNIGVTAVNDAPVANDDTASTSPLTALDVNVKANDTDPDDTVASLTVNIVSSSAGTTATVNPDGSVHFDPGATSGAQTVVYSITDTGGLSSNATLTVNVAANTPPTGTDNSATFDEDTGYALQISDFGFADADVGQTFAAVRIDTLPGSGTLTLNGVTLVANDVVSASEVNAGHLIFTPAANANGAAYSSFTFSVQDNFGGFATTPNTFTFNVNAVNDAPVNNVPGTQSTNEDTGLTFSIGNGNAISITDVDAGSGSLQVTLSVSHGALTLSGTTGLSFTTGDGNADVGMVFTGTLADINAALDGLSYTPASNYNGIDTLDIGVDDQGNSGNGGNLTDSDAVTINVAAENDAPTATIAAASYNATEQVSLALAGTGLSIGDIDAASGSMTATLSVTSGALTASAGTSGALVGGSGSNTITLTGTLAQINDLLTGNGGANIFYLINADTPPATDTLVLSVNDNGNTGSGGALTATSSATIDIAATNDAPTVTIAQPSYTASEQTNLSLEGT
ncbi:MAG TPA: DUF4347 domain-containing protein, partial [Rhodocyclaceae bacterium]|nr:DUF4347 domain-containing protein [Rhodocyclaceae bacterium]